MAPWRVSLALSSVFMSLLLKSPSICGSFGCIYGSLVKELYFCRTSLSRVKAIVRS